MLRVKGPAATPKAENLARNRNALWRYILRPISKICCACMTVAAMDLYCEPAVRLDLHVLAVNGLICNCRYSQLTPRTTPIFCPWLSRRGPCSVSLELVYLIFLDQRLICRMRAALIYVVLLREFAGGIQRNWKTGPHRCAIQSVPAIIISFQLVKRKTGHATHCNGDFIKIGFCCTKITNTFKLLFHSLLPISNFLKTMGFTQGNFSGPYS